MRLDKTKPLIRAGLLLAIGSPVTACAQTTDLTITGTGQGQQLFTTPGIGELSGITYLGGDSYALVSDTSGQLATATITIDRATGQITGSQLIGTVNVAGGSDLEAIAYDPRDGTVLVSDEIGNTITRHTPADGAQVGAVAVPTIYSNAQGNFGLESLSLAPLRFDLWTSNEESLAPDGPRSTNTSGTVVRLQRFDAAGQAQEQHGYLTQPHGPGDTGARRSGVADLVALPDGGLLVMERELGGVLPTYRNRLYLLDRSSAVDTSGLASLSSGSSGLAGKALLFQVDAGLANFEGITLGPMLSNGDYALVLISDDGALFNPQNLLTLRLAGLAVAGDLTGDFVVDAADLAVLLNSWGDSVSAGDRLAGDPSGDGAVGVADLERVLSNWSDGTPPATVVPEPGGVAAAGALMWAFTARRW